MEYIRGRQNPETQADHYELRRRINSLNLGGSKAKMNSSSNATRPPRQVCAVSVSKGPFILLCQIISVECPTDFDLRFMLIGCLGLPLFWLDVSSRKFKFVGHSTEIIRQSEIKRTLTYDIRQGEPKVYQTSIQCFITSLVSVLSSCVR